MSPGRTGASINHGDDGEGEEGLRLGGIDSAATCGLSWGGGGHDEEDDACGVSFGIVAGVEVSFFDLI